TWCAAHHTLYPFPTRRSSDLKVREAAYGWIDALAAEQFLHGPLIGVHPGDLGVMINVPGAAIQRTSDIARVLDGIGLDLWLVGRSEEHTSELQSRENLVCRLL